MTIAPEIPRQLHEPRIPSNRSIYFGGEWREPVEGTFVETYNPGRGSVLCKVAEASALDIDLVVEAAREGFAVWSRTPPLLRAQVIRKAAQIVRDHAEELAEIDAANCGNPVSEMIGDAQVAAMQLDFFAGLVTEIKGATIPMGPNIVNYSLRQPLKVVGRILAFNHPFMFCAGKMAAPLAAGNSVIMKPPAQSPLSALRLAELLHGLFPPGVLNVVPGGVEAGAAIARHPGIAKVALIGSVPAGRAVMRAASDTLKPVLLELGGKNALIVHSDADPAVVAKAVVAGMNFGWCGQSCGSTSRVFLHASIYEQVIDRVRDSVSRYCPGLPTDPRTTMGALVSRVQRDRVLDYIQSAKSEGATLVCGGRVPDDPLLANGFFVEPTIFADVRPNMRIAREEIFGPVLSILKWSDEAEMLRDVNAVEIWSNLLNMDTGPAKGASNGGAGGGRFRLGQRSWQAFSRRAFRRRETVRHWAGRIDRGTSKLYA